MPRPINCCICKTNLGEVSGRIRKDTEYICKNCLKNLQIYKKPTEKNPTIDDFLKMFGKN